MLARSLALWVGSVVLAAKPRKKKKKKKKKEQATKEVKFEVVTTNRQRSRKGEQKDQGVTVW